MPILILLNCILVPFTLWGLSMLISSETDAGMGLLFIWPFALGGLVVLLADGMTLIYKALWPRRPISKVRRIAIALIGTIPTLFVIGLVALYLMTQSISAMVERRALTPISKAEAGQLLTSCQVADMQRDNDNGKIVGRLRLTDSSLNYFERTFSHSLFTHYRTFDPAHYDSLFLLLRSPEMRNNCGYVHLQYLSDRTYQSLPAETKWVTADDVDAMIRACELDELHQGSPPHEIAPKAVGPSTKILFQKVQEPTGSYTYAYIEDMDRGSKEKTLTVARHKQSACQYHKPLILWP